MGGWMDGQGWGVWMGGRVARQVDAWIGLSQWMDQQMELVGEQRWMGG